MKIVSIALGENPVLHGESKDQSGLCGTSRIRLRHVYRPLRFDLTSAFLHHLLPALTEDHFPHLTEVDLKGFRILQISSSRLARPPNPELTWQYIRACPFIDEEFVRTANLDYRQPFLGYDYYLPKMKQEEIDEMEKMLERS